MGSGSGRQHLGEVGISGRDRMAHREPLQQRRRQGGEGESRSPEPDLTPRPFAAGRAAVGRLPIRPVPTRDSDSEVRGAASVARPPRSGHHFGRVAVTAAPPSATAPSAKAPTATAPEPAAARGVSRGPIQPLLDMDQFRELTPRSRGWGGAVGRYYNHPEYWHIENAINAYHGVQGNDQAATQERLRHLHTIEHQAYRWHSRNRPDFGAQPDPHLRGISTLLQDVQQAHQGQIAHTIQHGYQPWVPGGQAERNQANDLWGRLQNPGVHDNLRVHDTSVAGPQGAAAQNVPGFSNRAHAMHARLLTTQEGRDLLHRAITGPNVIDVRPNHPLAPNQEASADNQPGADALGLANPAQPLEEVNPGAGANVEVNVPNQMSDVDTAFLDPGWDHQGNPGRYTLAPAFLTYGHELGHAVHNQRGENRHALAGARYGQQQHARWHDAEEEYNITREENPLRQSHGLTPRQWHQAHPGGLGGADWDPQAMPAPGRRWYWWV